MMPDHCKTVSLKEVNFSLDENTIREAMVGASAYKLTEFMILSNSNQWSVVKLFKKEPDKSVDELFVRIIDIEIVSLPDDTIFLEDEELDVLNATAMAEKAEPYGEKCVVVKGKFGHVSFVKGEELKPIRIVDVVPPRPAKLESFIADALELHLIKTPIKVVKELIDLNELAKESETPYVMFPCYASGLSYGERTYYLDRTPELSGEEIEKITLLGCRLSLRIFKSVYGKEPEFINMCPRDYVEDKSSDIPTIVKCCGVKEGFELKGTTAAVSWGATFGDVVEALKALVED